MESDDSWVRERYRRRAKGSMLMVGVWGVDVWGGRRREKNAKSIFFFSVFTATRPSDAKSIFFSVFTATLPSGHLRYILDYGNSLR